MPQVSLQQALDLAINHQRQGQLDQAEAIYRQILAAVPDHPGATHLLGLIAGARGQIDLAAQFIQKAITLAPHEFMYCLNLARILSQAGRLQEAADILRRAAKLFPNDPQVHYDLGVTLQMLKQDEAALAAYDDLLRLHPRHADALNNKGSILKAQGRLAEAEALFHQALAAQPNCLEAHANLGSLLHSLRRYEEAIICHQAALRINPAHPQILFNLAVSLSELGRHEECIDVYRRAIALKPGYFDAQINLGNALRMIGDLDGAFAAYRTALQHNPGAGDVYNNLGIIFDLKGQLADSLACYRRALELKPGDASIHSNLLYSLHFHADCLGNPGVLLAEHRAWARRHADPKKALVQPYHNRRDPDRRLRVGYVSPDFRRHSVGRFMVPLLTHHDKKAVEVFCYTDVTDADSITDQIRASVDHWHSTVGLSDDALAALIRGHQIDILLDLTMHMRQNRLLTFAQKPAPIQLTYLAYVSTTGLDTIDYRFTDPHLDPPDRDPTVYSEKSLPIESYWCYAAPLDAPPINSQPALSEGRITFGCLNNFCKVSPAALEAWAGVLLAVPNSRLLLHANPGSHCDQTKSRMASMGVDPPRCDFVGATDLPEYFAHYHQIDIALDPFPYTGGTTTCDALWMGVPVISLAGKPAVSRSGVSILTTAGLAEWIATDLAQYISLAAAMASDLPHLQHLRQTLRPHIQNSPLMNAPHFAKNVESIYRQIWQSWCASFQPQ